MTSAAAIAREFKPRPRTRTTASAALSVTLPPEIIAAISLTAKKAGTTAENLVADILRDVFEPIFESRGSLAVSEANNAARNSGD